jgi:ATP-dependent HslUV protease subunit HslV
MQIMGTTIIAVKRDNKTTIAGDGQVTMGNTIFKAKARKIRRLYDGKVLTGFAGSVADAFALYEKFEAKLKSNSGNLVKSAVDLAKDWRTNKILQKLEAMLIVADAKNILLISGNGEVIQPDEDVIAIGSGGPYAYAAAKAMLDNTELSAHDIAIKSLEIASNICIYTNDNIIYEEI